MVINMVRVVEKSFELTKLLVTENVVNQEYELLALGTRQKKGDSAYTGHRAVEVISRQKAYLGDDQEEYHRTAREESIEWCKVFCKEE